MVKETRFLTTTPDRVSYLNHTDDMSEEEKPEAEKPERLFRQKLLDRLDSPDDIEQLMQVVNPSGWMLLLSLGGCIFLAGLGSIFFRIPITVQGTGVLMLPQSLIPLQSTTNGQLESLEVSEGDCIQKGDVLATVNPEDLKQQLLHQQAKLAELQGAAQNAAVLTRERIQLEKEAIASRRASLQKRLADARALTKTLEHNSSTTIVRQRQIYTLQLQNARSLTPALQDRRKQLLAQQRQNLQQRVKNARALVPVLKDNIEKTRQLLERGLIAENELFTEERQFLEHTQNISELEAQIAEMHVRDLELEEQYLQNQTRINELELQLQELQVQETDAKQRLQDHLGNIAQLEIELTELDARNKQLEEQTVESTLNRENQIRDLAREIARLEKQIADNSTIVSPYTGCIQSLTAIGGQLVSSGSNIGTIDVQNASEPLLAVAYFPVKEGKQIKPDMPVQVTPDNVERSRFGGIIGKVQAVSAFPVSREDAVVAVGNPQLVDSIMNNGGANIEAIASLSLDESTVSGYEWSSSAGPDQTISGGTTCTLWVQVDEKPPITLIFPFASRWFDR